MVYRIVTYSLAGIEALAVEAECDLSRGLPAFNIVGLPENTVKESKERIRAAIKNSKLPFPEHRITINLAPADLKKEGTSFDLPIAVSLVAQPLELKKEVLSRYVIAGELSLNGELRKAKGALSAAFLSKKMGLKGLIVPAANADEAAFFTDTPVYPVNSLLDVVNFLKGVKIIEPHKPDRSLSSYAGYTGDFSEIAGQFQAKRALEIAAAGKHNVLMTGPPGSGKTMMSLRLPTILPPMELEEALQTTMIYSAAGLLDNGRTIIAERPFRSPHHTASEVAIVGGGSVPKPGEISLAHNGVLFLDEFPEFKRPVIEALRQPLEEGKIHVSRANTSVTFPAEFMLVAAMNPCPCGNYGDESKPCVCSYGAVLKYRKKVSGPIIDRIDIHIEVPRVPVKELGATYKGEPSSDIRNRVIAARHIQSERFKGSGTCNGTMTSAAVKAQCKLDRDSHELLLAAADKFKLSARSFNKILKLSRTIADLEGQPQIRSHHLAEAIQLRGMDKQNF